MVSYGYPIIIGVVILGEFGLPLPVSAVLLAAGSLTIDATFNFFHLIILVSVISIMGDLTGYQVARYFGLKKTGGTTKTIMTASKYLNKWGLWGVFLTRWLLTPLCIPVNLVAGMTKYSWKKFVGSVIAGEIIWTTTYVYLVVGMGILLALSRKRK